MAFVGGRSGWMRDDEPSGPERLPGSPLHTPHKEGGNSPGGSFVHVRISYPRLAPHPTPEGEKENDRLDG